MEILINGILFVFLYIHFAIVLNCITEGLKEIKNDFKNFFVEQKEVYLYEIMLFIIVYFFAISIILIVILTPIINLIIFFDVCENKKIFYKALDILKIVFYPIVKILAIKIKI